MRKVRFRGKRKDNDEWVYGSLITNQNHKKYIVTLNGAYTIKTEEVINDYVYEVDPETVGQYTGVEDLEGNPIYEGDIVKDQQGNIWIIKYLTKYGGAGFYLANPKLDEDHEILGYREVKIISNKFEDPKLLK